jgi:hypothetical protein
MLRADAFAYGIPDRTFGFVMCHGGDQHPCAHIDPFADPGVPPTRGDSCDVTTDPLSRLRPLTHR